MNIIRKIFHWLGFPFVGIALLWSTIWVKQKAKTYAKYPNSMPLEVRYQYVYKLAKKVIYFRNAKAKPKTK